METIDEIYQNIGKSITDAIEEGNWTKAQLNIEVVGTGVAGYSGEYYIGPEKNDLSVRKLSREIRKWIRKAVIVDGRELYSRLILMGTFTLISSMIRH